MAIAQAARGIDQHQFEISGQAVVLQAVVTEDQVQRLGRQQGRHRATAIRINHQRHAAALHNQQRLITGHASGLISLHAPGQLRRLRAIAATDHTDAQPLTAAMLDQPENHRGLAGAADGDIADHHHRHGSTVDLALTGQKTRTLTLYHRAIQPLQRTQQAQRRMTGVPGSSESCGQAHQWATLKARLAPRWWSCADGQNPACRPHPWR